MTAAQRRLSIFLICVLLIALGVLFLGEDLKRHLAELDAWILGMGPLAMIGFLAVLIIGTTFFVPESLFGVAAGALFGLAAGLALAVAGNVLAAVLQYFLARRMLPRTVSRAMTENPTLWQLHQAFASADFRLQAVVRLTPLNPAVINYLLGASGVAFGPFMAASLFAFPHVLAEVFLGYAGRHALHHASGMASNTGYAHDALIGLGVCSTLALFILLSRYAKHAVERSVTTDMHRPGPGEP